MPNPTKRHYEIAEKLRSEKEKTISYEEMRFIFSSITGGSSTVPRKVISNEVSLVRKALIKLEVLYIESIAGYGYKITANQEVGAKQCINHIFMTISHGSIAGIQYKTIENKEVFRSKLIEMFDKKGIDLKSLALSNIKGLIETSASVNQHNQE